MYLFWHFMFAALLALVLYHLVVPNPAGLFILTILGAGVLIDVDHLIDWHPEWSSQILPTHVSEGLTYTVRTADYPFVLHLWLWPILLLGAALLFRDRKIHFYLIGAAAGWALHLALDGVIVLL